MATARQLSPVDAALAAYEQRSVGRTALARVLLFTVLWLWLLLNYGPAVAAQNLVPILIFILLGIARWWVTRGRPGRHLSYVLFLFLDVALLAYTILTPGRTYPDEWPWQMVLRQPSFLYFMVIVGLATLTFRPAQVALAGIATTMTWAAATWVIATRPGAIVGMADLGPDTAPAAYLARYLDPHYVHVDDAVVRIFVTLLVTAMLTFGAWRARWLIYEQAEAARERANLARYVAPSMVDRLSRMDRPMGAVRTQPAAVLFADLKGFTSLAEEQTPEATMQLLRDFHARMADAVFAHAGTLDKFIGDGLMATFGTPATGADDAARALACALAMQATMAEWNRQRQQRGEPPLRLGIGVHYGRVTTGDIGGSGRFEFAVIGDTVNVASRLERLTHELDEPLFVSDAVVAASGEVAARAALEPRGSHPLRGRHEPLAVWGLPRAQGA